MSVTGKHLLIRNKKQKAAEPVTEQAIRKAFCKLKIDHRCFRTGFKQVRLIFLGFFIPVYPCKFAVCLHLKRLLNGYILSLHTELLDYWQKPFIC